MAPKFLAYGLGRGHARAHSGLGQSYRGKDARNNIGVVKARVHVHFTHLLPSAMGLLSVHNSFHRTNGALDRKGTAAWTLTEYHIQSSVRLSPPLELGAAHLGMHNMYQHARACCIHWQYLYSYDVHTCHVAVRYCTYITVRVGGVASCRNLECLRLFILSWSGAPRCVCQGRAEAKRRLAARPSARSTAHQRSCTQRALSESPDCR